MSKGYNIIIELSNTLYRFPVNRAVISLYDYPATITDGTVFGTPAISTDGTAIVGQLLSDNIRRYKLNNIPTGKYTAIATGVGINAQVLVGYEDLDIGWGSDVTGSDIPYKDNTNISVADKIDNLQININADIINIENDINNINDDIDNINDDINIINETMATANAVTLNGKGLYTTIQSAITDSTTGDFIYVKKGEYNENITAKDGIHIHMEKGVVVTSPTDSVCLNGSNLSNFKLTGEGRFVNNGINSAINLSGSTSNFYRLIASSGIELNGGKQLMASNNYSSSDTDPYYYSEDGINYARRISVIDADALTEEEFELITETGDYFLFENAEKIPYGLKTIDKDGTNRVFAYKNTTSGYITEIGFYYSEDNGLTWILNNNGITPSADNQVGFYHSGTQTVFLSASNKIYKSGNYGKDTWTDVSTGLPSNPIIGAVLIGNYGYVLCQNTWKVYRADITSGTISWSVFDTGIESSSVNYLRSNGIDTLYCWDFINKKVMKCKVTETSIWSEINFPINLSTNTVDLYFMEWYNGYLYCSFNKIGIFRYYEGKEWQSILEGLEASSFSSASSIYKVNNFLYLLSSYTLRYFNGSQWTPINGGSNIHVEFDSAENLGISNNPNSSTPAAIISYSNLYLRCREIYSKRSTGLVLSNLYGKIDAKVGRIETGIPGMPNGETGSTALLTGCDGYFEANEIIVNNVGHAISPRWGIMHFKVNKMIVNNNHPTYQVANISQIPGQATIGTTSTIEFDEVYNNRGKYQGTCAVIHQIGTLNLKGRKMVNEIDATIASGGNCNIQIDYIENTGNWVTLQLGSDFPYKSYVKNTTSKVAIARAVLLNYDKIAGVTTKSITFDNCTFRTESSGNDYIMQVINYGVSGFTPVAMNVNLKGINTFNYIPNNLITFVDSGSIYVDGQPLLFGKYIYLVGNETTDGSWRMKATLSGNMIIEARISGSWVNKQTLTLI